MEKDGEAAKQGVSTARAETSELAGAEAPDVTRPVIDYAHPATVRVGVPVWAWVVNVAATLLSAVLCVEVVVLAWQHAHPAAAACWVLAFLQAVVHLLMVLPFTLWWTRPVTGRRGKAIRLLAVMPGLIFLAAIMALTALRLVRGPLSGH